jgi:dipeptidase E
MQYSVLLLSSSSVHGYGFLEYSRDVITEFTTGITTPLLFVPYAAAESEWDNYTNIVRTFFKTLNIAVTGIHTIAPGNATNYEYVFVGGGNTFRLLSKLQQLGLLPILHNAVQAGSMKYMGSSAGSNMAGKTICTTNDMPIVYPAAGFDALNLLPYQLNPHYLDPEANTTHKGETRDQRIAEYHQENDTPVIGLREGAYIGITAGLTDIYIGGTPGAKIFEHGKAAYEAVVGERLVLQQY